MKTLGNIAYDGYLQASKGVSLVSGATLPPFEGLTPAIQFAWELAAAEVKAALMNDAPMENGTCPRRSSMPRPTGTAPDTYRATDNTCSYCGSLNPDVVMARIEAGDVELTPTDKNYKVYVRNVGGAMFKQTYRDCPSGSDCKYATCTHWVTREMNETKFYFPHFSKEQKTRFVQLSNDGKLKLSIPGYFYVMPYFMTRGIAPATQ